MKLCELFESPDFGYKHFVNRDEELKNITFRISNSKWGFKIIAEMDNDICGFIACERETGTYFTDNKKTMTVSRSDIQPKWHGTGLGQILYDRAIQESKRRGYVKFRSDVLRSKESNKAWKRLEQRYPVKFVNADVSRSLGYNAYVIDLTKVPKKVTESPDFGYKKFIDKDNEIAKLKWKIKSEGRGEENLGFIITLVNPETENEPTPSMYGNYEGLIIARRVTDDTIQITTSKISKYTHDSWKSTGLGQLLYDKVIQEAKKAGYQYVISDYQLSGDARKAWSKLANRYPVTKTKLYDDMGGNVFQIDLRNVK